MKIMLRAAIAALSIASIGPALADGGEGTVANTQFTELPGVVAQAQVPNAPTYAQNGQQNRQAQTQQAQNGQAQSGSGARIRRLQTSRAAALGCSRRTLTRAPTANPKTQQVKRRCRQPAAFRFWWEWAISSQPLSPSPPTQSPGSWGFFLSQRAKVAIGSALHGV